MMMASPPPVVLSAPHHHHPRPMDGGGDVVVGGGMMRPGTGLNAGPGGAGGGGGLLSFDDDDALLGSFTGMMGGAGGEGGGGEEQDDVEPTGEEDKLFLWLEKVGDDARGERVRKEGRRRRRTRRYQGCLGAFYHPKCISRRFPGFVFHCPSPREKHERSPDRLDSSLRFPSSGNLSLLTAGSQNESN